MVCTTSPEQAFASQGDLRVLLGLTASSSGLDLALAAATDWVERYVTNANGGCIRRSVVRETVAGNGGQNLLLSRTPIRRVARMFNGTDTGTATEYCSTAFRVEDAEAGILTLTNDAGFPWDAIWDQRITRYPRPSAVARPWMVEYEAGYIYAGTSSTSDDWLTTSTGRDLPYDLERAVLMKAAEFYAGSSRGIEGVQVGPLRINYGSESLDPVAEMLAPYRRVV